MTDKKKQSILNRTIFDVEEHEMKFEVGDRVRVREWDDMKKEFVSERGGNLRCGLAYFMQDMRKYCGKVFEINRIDSDQFYHLADIEDYTFVIDMLEPVYDNKIIITSDGKTTTAKLYDGTKVMSSAKITCDAEDKFDFTKEAEAAFKKLTEYDYDLAYLTLKRYCDGMCCDDCKIQKLALDKGEEHCTSLVSFDWILTKNYTPTYLDNLIAELENIDETSKPKVEAEKAFCSSP